MGPISNNNTTGPWVLYLTTGPWVLYLTTGPWVLFCPIKEMKIPLLFMKIPLLLTHNIKRIPSATGPYQ